MIGKYFKMLRSEFSGYNGAKLTKDLVAGLTVAAVSLPLALAFGEASGADAAAGLVTAIIAGLVISLLAGASFQISGPTGTMTVVLGALVANEAIGINGVFMACFIAGFIRLLSGILKLGKLVSLIPRPVITGFTSGIAVIIAAGQIDNFFGTTAEGTATLEKIASYFEIGFTPHLWTVVLALLTVAVMIFWPKKWNAKVPSSLVALIITTAVFMIFRFEGVKIVGDIPKTLMLPRRLTFEGVDLEFIKTVLPASVSVALLCMIESLLCGDSASRMKNEPFDANIELIGQAAGNIVIPFFGGVPATAALARTSVAIRSGSQTRLAGIFHSLWLVAAMFLLGGVISQVPMAALAGVLVITAWRMNDWDSIKHMFKKKFVGEILQYLVTMIVTVVFDLTTGIAVGIVLALLCYVKNAAHFDVKIEEKSENSAAVKVYGDIFFGNVKKLTAKIKDEAGFDEIELSFENVPCIDLSSINVLAEFADELATGGKKLCISHMNESVAATFKKSGMMADSICESAEENACEAESACEINV